MEVEVIDVTKDMLPLVILVVIAAISAPLSPMIYYLYLHWRGKHKEAEHYREVLDRWV